MPRKTVAKQILEKIFYGRIEINAYRDGEEGYYIAYDFGGKVNPNFYKNLSILFDETGARYVQKSVIFAGDKETAYAVAELVKHYGGKCIIVKGIPLNFEKREIKVPRFMREIEELL